MGRGKGNAEGVRVRRALRVFGEGNIGRVKGAGNSVVHRLPRVARGR